MNIKFDEKSPIYLQIMDLIKTNIATKKLNVGDKLPSVRELASKLKVNPNTLQRAYQELERESIVYTQRGTGTFIKEDLNMISKLKSEMAKEVVDSFIERMKNLGFSREEIVDVISQEIKKEDK